jgi:hypothetical protein
VSSLSTSISVTTRLSSIPRPPLTTQWAACKAVANWSPMFLISGSPTYSMMYMDWPAKARRCLVISCCRSIVRLRGRNDTNRQHVQLRCQR